MATSIFLEKIASTLETKEQNAVSAFAVALLIIPRTLALNTAKDAAELVAELRAYHYTSQLAQKNKRTKCLAHFGLNLVAGHDEDIQNNFEAGILEPLISNVNMIRFATEAAITILRIDDLIQMDKSPNEKSKR